MSRSLVSCVCVCVRLPEDTIGCRIVTQTAAAKWLSSPKLSPPLKSTFFWDDVAQLSLSVTLTATFLFHLWTRLTFAETNIRKEFIWMFT